MAQRDVPEHRALVEHAIELARRAGDRGGESRAVNTLFSSDPDLARRVHGLQQALRLAREGGDRYHERAALHNLALTYNQLGLMRRALRHQGGHEAAALIHLGRAFGAVKQPDVLRDARLVQPRRDGGEQCGAAFGCVFALRQLAAGQQRLGALANVQHQDVYKRQSLMMVSSASPLSRMVAA